MHWKASSSFQILHFMHRKNKLQEKILRFKYSKSLEYHFLNIPLGDTEVDFLRKIFNFCASCVLSQDLEVYVARNITLFMWVSFNISSF